MIVISKFINLANIVIIETYIWKLK